MTLRGVAMDGGCYKAELMDMQPERNPGAVSGLLDTRRAHVLLGACGLALAALALAGASLLPGEENPDPAAEMRSADLDPPDAPSPHLTTGAGRPLASGEVGTVLSILFKDAPAATDAAREPASPGPAAPATPVRSSADAERTRSIQARLSALGFNAGDESGVWSLQTRQALRAFKTARLLPPDDVWDEATEQALFGDPSPRKAEPFAGVWAPHPAACSPQTNRKGLLPAVINQDGAWAGDVSCSFRNGRREGDAWRFAASCAGSRKRWTASVKLSVAGDVLTWSSERGSQRYVRCSSNLG